MGFMDVSTTTSNSFSFNKVGDTVAGTIVEIGEDVKTTNRETGEEVTSLVIHVNIEGAKSISHDREKDPIELVDGETRAVWVAYHRKLLVKALQDAIKESGASGLEIGGRLILRYDANGPQKDKSKTAPKLYVAKYVPAPKSVALDDF